MGSTFPSHRRYRRRGRELGQNVLRTHVARVDDTVGALAGADHFGREAAVGVREDHQPEGAFAQRERPAREAARTRAPRRINSPARRARNHHLRAGR